MFGEKVTSIICDDDAQYVAKALTRELIWMFFYNGDIWFIVYKVKECVLEFDLCVPH